MTIPPVLQAHWHLYCYQASFKCHKSWLQYNKFKCFARFYLNRITTAAWGLHCLTRWSRASWPPVYCPRLTPHLNSYSKPDIKHLDHGKRSKPKPGRFLFTLFQPSDWNAHSSSPMWNSFYLPSSAETTTDPGSESWPKVLSGLDILWLDRQLRNAAFE